MSDFWIVSSYRFAQQLTFQAAESELVRLQTKFPSKNFRIYRCKKRLERSGNYSALVAALEACADDNEISGRCRKIALEALSKIATAP